jgi:hypothetical protein
MLTIYKKKAVINALKNWNREKRDLREISPLGVGFKSHPA